MYVCIGVIYSPVVLKMETFTQAEHDGDIAYETKSSRVLRDGSDTDVELDIESKGSPI
jgi:hypothetical protein